MSRSWWIAAAVVAGIVAVLYYHRRSQTRALPPAGQPLATTTSGAIARLETAGVKSPPTASKKPAAPKLPPAGAGRFVPAQEVWRPPLAADYGAGCRPPLLC